MIFNKTTGYCVTYTFDPSQPITQNIYKCIVTGWNFVPQTVYYNYDATIVAPFGKSITCSVVTDTPTTRSDDGIYLCNSVNVVSNNSYYYASDVDATGATSVVVTTCDFIPTDSLYLTDDELVIAINTPDSCDTIYSFEAYMSCLANLYV
jgi:hypothetical protein